VGPRADLDAVVNRVPGRIFRLERREVGGGWRRPYNGELNNF